MSDPIKTPDTNIGCILEMLRFVMCGFFGLATVMFSILTVMLLVKAEFPMTVVLLILSIAAGFMTYG